MVKNIGLGGKGATRSYEAHTSHHEKNYVQRLDYLYATRNPGSLAHKMLSRTLSILHPLLKERHNWLTIGDFTGFEAKYLTDHNQKSVASDISDVYLKDAYQQNLIEAYSKVNVEQIHYEEDSFDYLLCKESFHHFPRAYLGLYEMIRVAKKGVVLIEPVDLLCKMSLLVFLKNLCDLFNPYLINRLWKNRFSWEVVGNYVFKISEREIEKVAMGMGLACVAFKGINIRLKPIPNSWGDVMKVPVDHRLERRVNRYLFYRDIVCKLRIIPHNHLCAIIFKDKPADVLLDELKKNKFQVIELPPNPYLH